MADRDVERRQDQTVRQRLDEIEEGYKQRAEDNAKAISDLATRTFVILAVMVAIFLATAAAFTVLQVRKVDKADQATFKAEQASQLARAIQEQRRDSTLITCEDSNDRNHDATDQLDAIIAHIKDPERRARAQANRDTTVLLINALVPLRNCKKVVAQIAPPPQTGNSP